MIGCEISSLRKKVKNVLNMTCGHASGHFPLFSLNLTLLARSRFKANYTTGTNSIKWEFLFVTAFGSRGPIFTVFAYSMRFDPQRIAGAQEHEKYPPFPKGGTEGGFSVMWQRSCAPLLKNTVKNGRSIGGFFSARRIYRLRLSAAP